MGSMGSFSVNTSLAMPPTTPSSNAGHHHQGSFGIQYGGAGTNFTYGSSSSSTPQTGSVLAPGTTGATSGSGNGPGHSHSLSGSQHAMGHTRRHSLGLNEAKKAAALAQSQRTSVASANTGSISSNNDSLVSPVKSNENSDPATPPPDVSTKTPEFEAPKTFISASTLSPSPPQKIPEVAAVGNAAVNPNAGASPRDFQFPPKSAVLEPSSNTMSNLMPPQPSYGGGVQGSPVRKNHEKNSSGNSFFGKSPSRNNNGHDRKPSGHYRTNSRNGNNHNNSKDINSNWRSQQRSSSQNRLQSQRSFNSLKDQVNHNGNNNNNNNNAYSDAYDMGLAPPPAFTPSHKPRGSFGGGSISSINTIASYGGYNPMPTFSPGHPASGGQNQGQGQGNAGGQNQQQRKSLFAPYLPQASLPGLINEGRLVTGTLRVNKKNRSDAYISTDGLLDADIFICGSKDRNRALEGDAVAVELLVVDEVWNSKKEKEEKKRRKDAEMSSRDTAAANAASSANASGSGISATDDNNNDASTTSSDSKKSSDGGIKRRGSLKQRPTQKKNDDLEVEGQSLLLVEEEEISDEFKPLYAGHVVAVIDRIPGQLFAGTLGLVRPSQQKKDNSSSSQYKPKIVWFKPNDKKVPLIAIPTEQAPKDFVENHEAYANKLFVASIKRWPITSLHPFGTLVSQLGIIDDAQTEIDAILRDNNFSCDEFPDNVSQLLEQATRDGGEVPKELQFLTDLPAELNVANRKDFTEEYVIGLSPTGDVCDASIHIKRLSDSKIEIGVHVADVTYFVKNGSLLDKKLKKRSISVNLAQGVRKLLLPDNLIDKISFQPSKPALSISTIFQIDTDNFEIDDVWIGESFVKPRQVINYDKIDFILTKDVEYEFNKDIDAIDSATADYIRTLALISNQFHRQRLQNKNLDSEPALTLLNQFDDEKDRLSLNIFEDNAAYSIVQEIFHKVNSTIAQRIFAKLGSRAFLRRQHLPTLSKYETFIRKVSNFNLDIDTTDSASLQNSILRIKNDVKRKAVETLLSKCMNRGKYYVAGKIDPENYGHWYYNLPLYTHFTSPSKRYADLVVHRQLKAVLNSANTDNDIEQQQEFKDDIENLKMVAEYCNFKKDNALAAQHQSVHLLLCQTVNAMSEKTGQVLTMGTVIQVYESSFDVLLPEFGIEKRVHGDQLPLVKAEFDKSKKVLELYWEKGIDSATYIPPDEKQPLSYRSSIKNKFRTSSIEAAKHQKKAGAGARNGASAGQKSSKIIESEELLQKLANLNLKAPRVLSPDDIPNSLDDYDQDNAETATIANNDGKDDDPIKPYFKQVVTRVDGPHYIQEVRELQQVPVLLRSEIGMALPCLTVRTLNPFANYD